MFKVTNSSKDHFHVVFIAVGNRKIVFYRAAWEDKEIQGIGSKVTDWINSQDVATDGEASACGGIKGFNDRSSSRTGSQRDGSCSSGDGLAEGEREVGGDCDTSSSVSR